MTTVFKGHICARPNRLGSFRVARKSHESLGLSVARNHNGICRIGGCDFCYREVCSLYLDQRDSVKIIHTYMAAEQGLRNNISIRQYVHHSNKYNRKQPRKS